MENSLNTHRASLAAAQITTLALICDFSSVCRYTRQTPHRNYAVLYFINDFKSHSASCLFCKPGFESFHAIGYALTHFFHRLI